MGSGQVISTSRIQTRPTSRPADSSHDNHSHLIISQGSVFSSNHPAFGLEARSPPRGPIGNIKSWEVEEDWEKEIIREFKLGLKEESDVLSKVKEFIAKET